MSFISKASVVVMILGTISFLFGPVSCSRGVGQGAGAALGGTVPFQETQARRDQRMDWFRQGRFGMFIHWGIYAVPAGEWGDKKTHGEWIMNTGQIPVEQYEKFAGQFNPVQFNAKEWVSLAKRAGMKYIVITSKHHDGFCLFDSRLTDYDIRDAAPFKRDIMKELAEECRRQGIKMCWYHSIMDWHHPDYVPRRSWEKRSAEGADLNHYIDYMKGQVRELLTNYGDIGILWFDGGWEHGYQDLRSEEVVAMIKSIQPDIIINNRIGLPLDYDTPEQHIPDTGIPGRDWETCMTMNDHWGYCRADNNWKSNQDLLRKLADIASKGGNFLLNVGPTAEGLIPQPSVERLEAMGRWLDVNGESIYGTGASPFENLPWGRCTQKSLPSGGTRLYLHVFDWPTDGKLVIPGLDNQFLKAFLLADKSRKSLAVSRHEDAQVIELPASPPDTINSVVVLDIKGKPAVIKPPEITAASDIFVGSTDVELSTSLDDVTIRYTIDGTIPNDQSPAYTEPVRLTDSATVTARLFRGDQVLSGPNQKTFTRAIPRPPVKPDRCVEGVGYEYYEGNWEKLPDFNSLQPKATGTTKVFDISILFRQEYFALRWRGYVTVPATGVFTFYTESDDGSRLYIGDQLVVDNDGLHGSREVSGVLALEKGIHPITVTFFQGPGGIDLKVSYTGPQIKKQLIPASALQHQPAGDYQSFFEETKEQRDRRLAWWREARFGMFIHWGLYAIPAGEWKGKQIEGIGEWIMNTAQIPVAEYEPLAQQFNPVRFDAKEWVGIAKSAGMKYIVITSKHHDGFCLFDSKYTDYDVLDATPFKRDILKELADECRKQDIKMCWYHSIMDWHHPDYLPRRPWEKRPAAGAVFDRYIDYMKNQLAELVGNYGKIGVLWFDGEWENTWNHQYGKDLYGYVRSLQPDIIINNRVDKGRQGMAGLTRAGEFMGDFGTPEQEIPPTGLSGVDWETCMTMNDTWGFKKDDHNWKSDQDLIRKLVDIASKGGNFLLNVGPTADGLIPAPSVERLQAMGRWMTVNGESIYGTQASPFEKLPWGRCTQKSLDNGITRLYLHVFDWPRDGRLDVPGLKNKVTGAYLLADENRAKLPVSRGEAIVALSVPEETPDPINTVIVLEIEGQPDIAPFTASQGS